MKDQRRKIGAFSHDWLFSAWSEVGGRVHDLFAELPEVLPLVFRALRRVDAARHAREASPAGRRFDFERRYFRQFLIGGGDEALYPAAGMRGPAAQRSSGSAYPIRDGGARALMGEGSAVSAAVLFPVSSPGPNYLGVSRFVAGAVRSRPLWLMPRSLIGSGGGAWSPGPLRSTDAAPLRASESDQRRASRLVEAAESAFGAAFGRADAAALARYFHRGACLDVVCRTERLRRVIAEQQIGAVFVPNEQVEPLALAVAAGRRAGVATRQHLHGLESALYAPFLVDEMWVWDRRAFERMLTFGADASRMVILENLELGFWGRWYLEQTAAGTGEGTNAGAISLGTAGGGARARPARRCLFLGQFHGGAGANNPFLAGFELVVRAIAQQGGRWALDLRNHPFATDDQQVRAALAEAGRRVELRVVPTSAPLLEQILAADCVLTVSSSGAAVAHAFGRHAGVIWLPEIEAHHGPPPGWVAAVLRGADELARFLSDAPETRLPPREELESWVQALENRVADRFP